MGSVAAPVPAPVIVMPPATFWNVNVRVACITSGTVPKAKTNAGREGLKCPRGGEMASAAGIGAVTVVPARSTSSPRKSATRIQLAVAVKFKTLLTALDAAVSGTVR